MNTQELSQSEKVRIASEILGFKDAVNEATAFLQLEDKLKELDLSPHEACLILNDSKPAFSPKDGAFIDKLIVYLKKIF